MTGPRRNEALLVGLLLIACCAAVVLVFVLMREPGRAFEEPSRSWARPAPSERPAAAESPVQRPPAAAVPPSGGDDQPPEGPGGPGAAPEDGSDGEEEDGGEDPVVHDGQAELVIELLPPENPEERQILVQVVDIAGEPVPRALVVFREGSAILYRARADATGLVSFQPYAEEAGPFRVDALAHGFVPAHAPAVAAGAETQLILEYRPIVEGKVRGADGHRGVVRLFQEFEERVTPIAPDGTFRFENLDPGDVVVQAAVDVYGTDTERLRIQPGMRHYVSLRVRTHNAITIQGKIEGWPGRGEMLINGLPATVSPSGRYVFKHAVTGVNEVLIDAPGRALLRERFDVRTLQMSIYDFRTHSEGTIKGRVRKMFTNLPVPGAEVRVGFDRGDRRNDRVPLFPIERVPVVIADDEGRFEITRLDKRLIYLVSVVAQGFGQYLEEAVPEGGRLIAKMPEGPFVFGRLRGVGGLPRNAVVTAVPLDSEYEGRRFNKAEWQDARGERDRQGFYGLSGLLPGAHLLRVDAPGFGSIETVLDLRAGERTRLDLRVRRGIEVDRDEQALLRRLPPVTVDLEEGAPGPDTTILRVDARRPSYQPPFDGILVRFFDGEEEFSAPMEFTESQVEIYGLPEATYRAILTHPALARPIVRDRIVLRRGVPVEVEMR